jgi:hypothetical protein
MALRFLIRHVGIPSRSAIVLASIALLCGCRPKADPPVSGSSTVVIPPAPVSASADASRDIGHKKGREARDPIVGFRLTAPPDGNTYPKVSAAGDIVAIWTHVHEVEEEDGPTALYLLGKRVDTDEEIARLLLEYPLGSPEQYCRTPGSPKLLDCPANEVAERKVRATTFLGGREWRDLSTFSMAPELEGCSEDGKLQSLSFPNVTITFSNLTLRVAKPSGEVLIERKLPPWKVYGTYPRVVQPGLFFAPFIGLDLERRVLLVGLSYCEIAVRGDHNYRFHTVRLPQLE